MRPNSVLSRCFLHTSPGRRRRTCESHIPMHLELLEDRALLSTLTVNVNDPTANNPGDHLYAQIHEALAEAEPGDQIKVHAGIYEPFTVSTDNLTIREATPDSDPVIDATGAEAGVHIDADGITLRGLIVENSQLHGFLVTGHSNTLSQNTARNNGLAIDPLNPPTVFQNQGLVGGFTLVGADGNVLNENVSEGNALNGFLLRLASDNNTLKGNSAINNGTSLGGTSRVGNGFSVLAGSDIFTATPEETSDGTILRNNTAMGNGTGFLLSGAFRVTPEFTVEPYPAADTAFIGNSSIENSSAGIVASNTVNTRMIGNLSGSNGFDGIVVSSSENATVNGNVSDRNAYDGFYLPGIRNSSFSDNVATDNGQIYPGHGFYVAAGSDSFFTGNMASGNPFGGFELVQSHGNTLNGNTALANGEDGFLLLASSSNTVTGNLSDSNERDGFRLESTGQVRFNVVNTNPFQYEAELVDVLGSSGNTLRGNTAQNNSGAGFHLVGASGNTLTGNTASGNGGDGFRVERLDVFAPNFPPIVNAGELLGSFDSDANVFKGNESNDNDGWGYFFLDSLFSNLFKANESMDNGLGDFNF